MGRIDPKSREEVLVIYEDQAGQRAELKIAVRRDGRGWMAMNSLTTDVEYGPGDPDVFALARAAAVARRHAETQERAAAAGLQVIPGGRA